MPDSTSTNPASAPDSTDTSPKSPLITYSSDSASVRKELHWLEKLNICGQLGLVVVGIIGAFIYECQLRIMNKQLTAMSDANYVAKQAVYVSCINSQIARSTLLEVQSGGSDSHNVAKGSLIQAYAMARDESAQFKIVEENPDVALGRWPFKLINNGRSNAMNVRWKSEMKMFDPNDNVRLTFTPSLHNIGHVGIMYQGDSFPSAGHVWADGKISSGKLGNDYVLIGRIDFTDIFGVKHWHTFCRYVYQSSNAKIANECADFIRADKNTNATIPADDPVATEIPKEVVCEVPSK